MNHNQFSAFEEDFFLYHEHFERVGAESLQSVSFAIPYESKSCSLCHAKFGFFSIKHKCGHCGLYFCGECIRKIKRIEYCEACYAVEKNMTDFTNLNHLLAYKNNNSSTKFKDATATQTGILFFLDFLKDKDSDNHEYGILPLYRLEKFYVSNPIAQTVQQIIYNHILKCSSCKKRDVLIDLFCDLSIAFPKNLKKCHFEDDLLELFIDPLNLQLTASTSRLILLLVENLSFDPENPKYINVIGSDSKIATAFMTAALAHAHNHSIPTVFEESKPSNLIYKQNYLPQIVENVLSLYDGYLNSSLASQYYGSIILLSISESDSGCSELVKYLPLHNIIHSLILFCPSHLGLSRNEGKIAVYLSRMVKNLWMYCEKSRDSEDLLSSFFPSVLGFILDVTEKQCGYDKFSHLCIVQSIALDIVDSVEKHEKLRNALISPFLQELFVKMKAERQSQNDEANSEKIQFLENQNKQMKQLNQEQLQKIQQCERENQLIKSKLLDTQAMISAKDAEIIKLNKKLEASRSTQGNGNKNAVSFSNIPVNEVVEQKSNTDANILNSHVDELNSSLANKNAEIAKLNGQLKEKEKIIGENTNELNNCVSKIQNLTVKWNSLAELLLNQEDHDSNLEEIVQLPSGF